MARLCNGYCVKFPFFERRAWRVPAAERVRLSQRQVFILPSRVGWLFGVAQLLMLLAAINYQNSLAYGLTFLLMALSIVALLHTWRNLVGLELHAGQVAPVFVGGQARFSVQLSAGRHSHQAIALNWPYHEPTFWNVAAHSIQQAEVFLPAQQRGWLRPGRLRVESRFPLGIFVAWSWVELELAVLVYPKPIVGELPSRGGYMPDIEAGAQDESGGVDDYRGLRLWQIGDSLRHLDWKAYSRERGLLVKDFASFSGTDWVLDFSQLTGPQEARLSLLCHWVLALDRAGAPFLLSLPAQQLGPDTGVLHRDNCLRALALFMLPSAEQFK